MAGQAAVGDSLIGLEFGHYRILERVGSGGMGVVYRGYDAHLDREVAIKVLNPGTIADDHSRKRFRNEALALSKLNHPNIATVHDFETHEGRDFLVMEFIQGIKLADRLVEGSLPEKDVIALGIQLAEGLSAAHEHAVVHRDLKPGNLLLNSEGRLKILDFGLAKLRLPAKASPASETLSETHAIAGTLPYMAPEQVLGGEIDARTDIHAAGIVLYEMATGLHPFSAVDRSELISAILRSAPTPASRCNSRLSPELARIIGKCLEREPEDRYQSAKELAIDLRRLQTGLSSALQPTPPRRRWPSTRAVGLGFLSLAAVLALSFAFSVSNWRARIFGGATTPRIESLAVLPFTTNVGEGTSDYLADGITEGVINDLSQVPTLRVMARSTVFRFKGKEIEPQQVGATLKVAAVVTGHIAQHGDALMVQTELVNVADGTQIWGQQFLRKMKDVSSLQGDIAQEIASKLRLQLSGKQKLRMMEPGTRNQEAYQFFLRGRFHLAQRTESGLRQALHSFQQAVALDPSYGEAWASLAIAYNLAPAYLPLEEARKLPNGRTEAEKAIALNPILGEAHTALLIVSESEFNWAAVEREFKLAIEANPNDPTAHYFYALVYLQPQERYDEAIAEYRKALELDPLSAIINTNYGYVLMVARRFDEAREQYRRTLELDPTFRIALQRSSELEAYLGNYSAARQLIIRAYPEATEVDFGSGKDGYYLGRLKLKSAEEDKILNFSIAYAMLGRKDEAFDALSRAMQIDPADLPHWIRRPEFDSLHSNPRYAELLRQMNFSQ